MYPKLPKSYFPDLDEQLQTLQKDYAKIYDELQKIKAEEKRRIDDLSTVELVSYKFKATP
jgi:hypothetical protein